MPGRGALIASEANLLIVLGEFLKFLVAQFFNVDHLVMGMLDRANNLIQFELQCTSVAILGVLYQKNHQERNNGGRGINDELPTIRVVEVRPGKAPEGDTRYRDEKRPTGANHCRHACRKTREAGCRLSVE